MYAQENINKTTTLVFTKFLERCVFSNKRENNF